MKSRVTTGVGDGGASRALSGDTLSKSHPVMEAVGAVDELRAQIALLRQTILRERPKSYEAHAAFLLWLAHLTFPIGTECSDPETKHPEYRQLRLTPEHLAAIEAEQSRLEAQVDFAKAFIAAATNLSAAEADRSAAVTRRAERSIVRLKEAVPALDTALLIPMMNRLSDYFFVLARALEDGQHERVDYTRLT